MTVFEQGFELENEGSGTPGQNPEIWMWESEAPNGCFCIRI